MAADPTPAPIKRIAQIINHQLHPSEPAVASAAVGQAKRIHTEMVEPAVQKAEAAEYWLAKAKDELAAKQARIDALEAELEAARTPPKVYVVDESTT